jgi:hypothetical protein
MCYLVVERYSFCRCVYYQHDLEKCAKFGEKGHERARVKERTVLVGRACGVHSEYPYIDGVLVGEAAIDSEVGISESRGPRLRHETIGNMSEGDREVGNNLKSLVEAQWDVDALPAGNSQLMMAPEWEKKGGAPRSFGSRS